jgi:hypothetical protein
MVGMQGLWLPGVSGLSSMQRLRLWWLWLRLLCLVGSLPLLLEASRSDRVNGARLPNPLGRTG